MAKRYKYSFTKKEEAQEGRASVIMAAVSFGLFLILSLVSFACGGKGGTVVGAGGLFAMLLALYGCYTGCKSFGKQRRVPKRSVIGALASGVMFILWLALFLVGVK